MSAQDTVQKHKQDVCRLRCAALAAHRPTHSFPVHWGTFCAGTVLKRATQFELEHFCCWACPICPLCVSSSPPNGRVSRPQFCLNCLANSRLALFARWSRGVSAYRGDLDRQWCSPHTRCPPLMHSVWAQAISEFVPLLTFVSCQTLHSDLRQSVSNEESEFLWYKL